MQRQATARGQRAGRMRALTGSASGTRTTGRQKARISFSRCWRCKDGSAPLLLLLGLLLLGLLLLLLLGPGLLLSEVVAAAAAAAPSAAAAGCTAWSAVVIAASSGCCCDARKSTKRLGWAVGRGSQALAAPGRACAIAQRRAHRAACWAIAIRACHWAVSGGGLRFFTQGPGLQQRSLDERTALQRSQ